MNNHSSFAIVTTIAIPILSLLGCSSSESGSGGGASTSSAASSAGGAASSTSSTSTGGGASTSTSTSTSTGGDTCSGVTYGLPIEPCTPGPGCANTDIAQCVPIHDNAGAASFGLRMAHLELTAPTELGKGLLKNLIRGSILPALPECNLNGGGTFSWLLAFDTVAGTLTTGGAKPPTNPALGYSFLTADYMGLGGNIHVAPVTLTAPLGASCTTTSSAADLTLPVYFGQTEAALFTLPLRQARFSDVLVSGNHDCIGKYNAAGLKPSDNCYGTDQTPEYFPGGKIDGYINLEDADNGEVPSIKQSLCVVLSGDSVKYGDGKSPARCKRVNGKIVFAGDWCTATNQAATAQCKDAVRFAGAFAASGVIIN